MALSFGIDAGAVSIKVAVAASGEEARLLEGLARRCDGYRLVRGEGSPPSGGASDLLISPYVRTKGRPARVASDLLKELVRELPPEAIKGARATGSTGAILRDLLGIPLENEFKAVCKGVGALYPRIRTVFEMGGGSSKYLLLERDKASGDVGIRDYETSGDCAAGTGSFMDQQASRLRYGIEEVGDVVLSAEKGAKIAGRCSVFAKSDMIHAQQKGYQPPQILKGLCEAVARNFKSSIVKGKRVEAPIVFIGGVAANKGVVQAMREVFGLGEEEMIIPPPYAWFGAIGAALLEGERRGPSSEEWLAALSGPLRTAGNGFPTSPKLSMEKVVLLRDRVKPYNLSAAPPSINAYLGVDIGSVSTNLVLMDEAGEVIKEIYLRTDARPIQAVNTGLREIERELGGRTRMLGVGTTGSGRELIGELIGADTVNDEITAHKTGATYIADRMLGLKVDTIFEVGGQDSKYISLQDGIVVDFTMNEACAAGTGSFLEERAEELDISIKGEFASVALGAENPIRLGERCTVFMEQDVNSYLRRGASKEDLVAGLAYSVAYNYINRVVRGRAIGGVIFFQGGTAYNDSVAAAFSQILGKEIIVPPYNGVVGALGMALLARERVQATGGATKFRGYNLEEVDYALKEFTCRSCTNYCDIQMFKVEGNRTYWGDKCSDKFRKRAKVEKEPTIPDLISLREEALHEGYPGGGLRGGTTVGIPRCMYQYEQFPFWLSFFRSLGFGVILSDETSKNIVNRGIEASVAEPCFPIQVAHGHVQNLLDKGADLLFLPNLLNSETHFTSVQSHACPWGQTLPFVVRSAPAFEDCNGRFLTPTVQFRLGREFVGRELRRTLKEFKVPKEKLLSALDDAYEAQSRFKERILGLGRDALRTLKETGEPGIVLVGRPYNIFDGGVNLNVARKLRDYYGVNVVPLDFLPVDEVDISDVNANMFWNYGRKILAAAKIVRENPHLHIIYITNFKCGPDSFIKHFIVNASGKPFLSLQFDGHSNDAGIMTRCEAYLDSKGILRWWKADKARTA